MTGCHASLASVVMMCGLPASGKTTTAGLLHTHAGGVLIRSCDVYADLGIRLPDWVERTRGFTVNVHEYDQMRDRAYEEIAWRLATSLDTAALVILDAVYGERAKRAAIYTICQRRGVEVGLVHCRCDDARQITRRFDARRGRETTPEHEASDRSIFHDIERRWEDPRRDLLSGRAPAVITVDTLAAPPIVAGDTPPWLADRLREVLAPASRQGMRS
jgi:predicted kinase